jgi:hypothetical protein
MIRIQPLPISFVVFHTIALVLKIHLRHNNGQRNSLARKLLHHVLCGCLALQYRLDPDRIRKAGQQGENL